MTCDSRIGLHYFSDESFPICRCGEVVAVSLGKDAGCRMRDSTHAERLAELDRRAKVANR